ncbi:MAG: hypothetical protein WAM60_00520 [Candidatus Promineifilaceae bacterium]
MNKLPQIQRWGVVCLFVCGFALVACNSSTPPTATETPGQPAVTSEVTPTLEPTTAVTAVPSPTTPATAVSSPTTPATAVPTATDQPTMVPPATVPPVPSDEPYLDNRSDPIAVLDSLVNAINRREFLRAYSYWEENAADLPPYEQFAQGYDDTSAVELQTGTVYSGVGAGNLYFDVQAILTAQTTQGGTQAYVGCYTLHLGNPAIQGALPFRPLGIQKALINQVADEAEAQAQLNQQCLNENGQPNGEVYSVPAPPAPDDVSSEIYLDDLSDGTQVIRSYFNAVNRHEYVRAYDYWENQAVLGPLDDFIAGYEDTVSVQLLTGTETGDAGAGQRYSQVPVVLMVETADGEMQTFSGCYTLHLASPAIQATPPFQPWGIQSADIQQAPNDSDSQQLLAQACS